jgi:teichuronic acid biosynthesis glycosyltransferase TuaC
MNLPDMQINGPHVLTVSNHWSRKNSHAGIFVDRQIRALRGLGVRISTFDSGLSHSPIKLFRKWLELRRTVQELKPDLVHARYGSMVALLSVLSGCRTVLTYCGSDLHAGAGTSRLRAWLGVLLSNVAALRAEAIICVSPGLRDRLWWQRKQVAIIPNGVDLTHFFPHPREQARQRLGWNTNDPVVMIDAARDPVCKGLDLAHRSIEIARRKLPSVQLKVLDRVPPEEMPYYCSAADLLLCASRREGSPNIVKESLACNLPVVSTPVGDVPERLEGVIPSRVVPRDPVCLAEAMVEILRERKRSNGREHVRHLTLELAAQKVLEVYHAALFQNKRTAATSSSVAMSDTPQAVRVEV